MVIHLFSAACMHVWHLTGSRLQCTYQAGMYGLVCIIYGVQGPVGSWLASVLFKDSWCWSQISRMTQFYSQHNQLQQGFSSMDTGASRFWIRWLSICHSLSWAVSHVLEPWWIGNDNSGLRLLLLSKWLVRYFLSQRGHRVSDTWYSCSTFYWKGVELTQHKPYNCLY